MRTVCSIGQPRTKEDEEASLYSMLLLKEWRYSERLVVFEDGDSTIDINRAENTLRKIAIGRKNWLFFKSKTGGRTAAIFANINSACRRHSVEPFSYLKDAFTQPATNKHVDLAAVLLLIGRPD